MTSYFKHEVFGATRPKCRKCKERYEVTDFPLQKDVGTPTTTRSRICKTCHKQQGVSKFKPNGTLRARHKTLPKEKLQAYCRDKKCLHPSCSISEYQRLDFHHAFSTALDKLPRKTKDGTPVDWNKHTFGVMLCRKHHDLVETDKDFYRFCQYYLRFNHHKTEEVLPELTSEEYEAMQSFFSSMKV